VVASSLETMVTGLAEEIRDNSRNMTMTNLLQKGLLLGVLSVAGLVGCGGTATTEAPAPEAGTTEPAPAPAEGAAPAEGGEMKPAEATPTPEASATPAPEATPTPPADAPAEKKEG
jgi:hypothetical protein